MPLVQYALTATAVQIEGLPEGDGEFQRSCSGALHLRPGASLQLTADELSFLKQKRPDVAAKLLLLATDEQLAPPAAPAPAPIVEEDVPVEKVDAGPLEAPEADVSEEPPARPKRR